jgi:alkylation response protein AidB-like acyl-CoA dehydrogenase
MDYLLSEDDILVRNLARRFARERVLPVAKDLDEMEEFPRDLLDEMAASDLFAISMPEEYGGTGESLLQICLVVEELSWACPGVAVSYAASSLGSAPILISGNPEQKMRFLPDLISGKKIAAFALTEAGAGSDSSAITTKAQRAGDGYVLNGTKQWITNGGEADIYTVIAMTDPAKGARGASAFIVEKGMPGFSFGKKEKKMGIRASATCELILDDVFVPKDNLVGREGLGFIISMKTLDKGRPGVGAQSIGLAQGALDRAVEYSATRKQFGKPISSFQAIGHMIADMATQIEAARALVYSVARMIDAGAKDYSKESAMAKMFASDVAMRVAVDALQIFGGYGYMRDYPMEKLMRDAKVTQIYEGTNQIQRDIIAQQIIRQRGKLQN